ncbi:hypothetical protein CP976_01885 [Streptomyces coeruleorubidus]|uniref:Uncharacterized protein n=1 Tax=Streptomyces coeruleorubidus TaxID=116188 RepID=A0A5J6HTF7_STRC4|nr:hypothetical protein CP976_01885 [Streptomyces coeruleorubidus]
MTMPTGDGSMTVRSPRVTDRLSVPVVSSRAIRARGAFAATVTVQACSRCSAPAGAVVRRVAASAVHSAATTVLIGTAM